MTVSRLACCNWRNISECDVPFRSGINVLWGKNAQGKSNILESIYYFARGRSFRGAKERELVKFGSDFSSSRLDFRKSGYTKDTSLEAVIQLSGKKRLTRNGAQITPSEMMGSFRAVLFSPSTLSIVSGGPAERRNYLDVAISQLSQHYLLCLRRYTKILNERNALLKHAADGLRVTDTEWEVYADGLSEYASLIASYRNSYVSRIKDSVSEYFAEMTDGRELPSMTYTSHALTEDMHDPFVSSDFRPDASVLRKKLTNNVDRECAVGSTLWGIHKDDIQLSLNGKEAKLYASQGQQRSIALAMKLAEAETAFKISGEFPVILLDDVFSELDESRRHYILESLGNDSERQIIITSCEPDVIPDSHGGNVNFLRVENGSVIA